MVHPRVRTSVPTKMWSETHSDVSWPVAGMTANPRCWRTDVPPAADTIAWTGMCADIECAEHDNLWVVTKTNTLTNVSGHFLLNSLGKPYYKRFCRFLHIFGAFLSTLVLRGHQEMLEFDQMPWLVGVLSVVFGFFSSFYMGLCGANIFFKFKIYIFTFN